MRILTAAVISEGLLVVFALLLQNALGINSLWNPSYSALLGGLVLTIPPLIANHLLWRYAERTPNSLYYQFSREVIAPLCRQATLPIAVTIAVLSGICEEWFFRGTVGPCCERIFGPLGSCALTSVVFACVHFIGSFKRYGGMIPLYTIMGIYLWTAHRLTGSLAAVALLHGLYNFIVIISVRRTLHR
jgi:membrane protease YdiL (CAAX protease family)